MATNTYVALDKKTVTSTVVSVEFTSIPSTYTDLVIVISASANTPANSYIRFNGDTTSGNYSATRMYGNGSTATSTNYSTETFSYIGDLNTTLATTIVNIQNYANTTTFKSFLSQDSLAVSGTGAWAGLWDKSPIAAITSIEIGSTAGVLAVGSTVSLYGIMAEGVSPTPKATGGAIYSDSTYYYHVFGATGVFTPTTSITADVLVVAGGGGGAGDASGGGGAGGLLAFTSQSLTATAYTCTVGAGGAKGYPDASQGGNSQFGSLTASVGGGFGTIGTTAGTGGSGGGGGRTSPYTAGAGTSSQGNAGGTGSPLSYLGGGGGAGAVGGAGGGTAGNGAGGIGSSTYSSWSVATGVGQNVAGTYYLAGGGGGGTNGVSTLVPGVGGSGGGGAGGYSTSTGTGTAGTVNTGGGGGGGGGAFGNTANGAAGGSGVIVVRYLKA
jgi:hypothetical protein